MEKPLRSHEENKEKVRAENREGERIKSYELIMACPTHGEHNKNPGIGFLIKFFVDAMETEGLRIGTVDVPTYWEQRGHALKPLGPNYYNELDAGRAEAPLAGDFTPLLLQTDWGELEKLLAHAGLKPEWGPRKTMTVRDLVPDQRVLLERAYFNNGGWLRFTGLYHLGCGDKCWKEQSDHIFDRMKEIETENVSPAGQTAPTKTP